MAAPLVLVGVITFDEKQARKYGWDEPDIEQGRDWAQTVESYFNERAQRRHDQQTRVARFAGGARPGAQRPGPAPEPAKQAPKRPGSHSRHPGTRPHHGKHRKGTRS